jgi:stage III sporulation protein AA
MLEDAEHLEEVAMDLGRPLALRRGGKHVLMEREVSKDDLHYLVHRIGGFREDGRTGLERTVHRIAAIRDRYGEMVGASIRLGRFVHGVAEPLRPYLSGKVGLVVIGPPGSGKTTLLRDVVRIVGEAIGPRCIVVDTSNEIGGDGRIPHPGIAPARRIQVPSPEVQARTLMQALANHGPEVMVVDEIGYHGDVAVIQTIARRGVGLIATAHGESLQDLLENPVLYPLLGDLDMEAKKRRSRPVFKVGVEVRARGVYRVYADLSAAIDGALEGREVGETLEV